MKVSNSGPGISEGLRDTGSAGAVKGNSEKRNPARSGEAAGGEPSEKVALSSRGKDIAKAREAAGSSPEINEAKVARLKAMVENGSYKVDAEKVADRLVDEHLATAF